MLLPMNIHNTMLLLLLDVIQCDAAACKYAQYYAAAVVLLYTQICCCLMLLDFIWNMLLFVNIYSIMLLLLDVVQCAAAAWKYAQHYAAAVTLLCTQICGCCCWSSLYKVTCSCMHCNDDNWNFNWFWRKQTLLLLLSLEVKTLNRHKMEDHHHRGSRLPCYVFFLCMLT